MGTNYYLRRHDAVTCSHCGQDLGHAPTGKSREGLHIGKSSAGWVFALRVYPDDGINTLADWMPLFAKYGVVDEYGAEWTPEEIVRRITERSHSRGLLRSAVDGHHCVGNGPGTYDYFIGEFS